MAPNSVHGNTSTWWMLRQFYIGAAAAISRSWSLPITAMTTMTYCPQMSKNGWSIFGHLDKSPRVNGRCTYYCRPAATEVGAVKVQSRESRVKSQNGIRGARAMFRFEKLEVWHAAVSISSNIAEGSGRISDKDFARFIEISYGSLMEVVSQSAIAHRQQFLPKEAYDSIYKASEELARMLSGLRATLLQNNL